MVLPMSRPVKTKHGVYQFRQKVPADLLSAMGGKKEVGWSLRTKDPDEARERHREAAAKQALVWQSMRAAPASIPHRTLMELVGKHYAELNAMLEMEPGEPSVWGAMSDLLERVAAAPGGLNQWYGQEADRMLQGAGLSADAASRLRLVSELHKAWGLWALNQGRRALGDYSPDPAATRFPEPVREVASGLTLTDAFGLWEREHLANGKSPRTVASFRQRVASLRMHLRHDDAGKLTPEDLISWCDYLRFQEGQSPKTVAHGYLAAIKAVLEVARLKRRLPANPAKEVKVRVPKPTNANGRLRRGFTDAEADAILAATLTATSSSGRRSVYAERSIRWVPWLCAYTGARVAEMCQLRREDVLEEEGVLSLRITPEAGSTKSGNARVVPLHSHLHEMGFPAFVRELPPGPIFHAGKGRGGKEADQGTLAGNMGKKVGLWVRKDVGITDRTAWPNHGWRHRFKTLARLAGIHPEERDALQGHEDGRASFGYGTFDAETKRRAVEKIPRQGPPPHPV